MKTIEKNLYCYDAERTPCNLPSYHRCLPPRFGLKVSSVY